MKRKDRFQLDAESSMSYWWPKIKDLDIPQPKTIRVPMDGNKMIDVIDIGDVIPNMDEYTQACADIGFPVFLRNNAMSAKHSWKESCYVPTILELSPGIRNITEHTLMADMVGSMRIDALFFREFLKLETTGFTAFHGNMPINKEMRCFIRDGTIESIHPYWFEDVFEREVASQAERINVLGQKKAMKKGLLQIPKNWKELLAKNNYLSYNDNLILETYLSRVCNVFSTGYWSVDFTKGVNGVWYLIDMARGEISQHHPDCNYDTRDADTITVDADTHNQGSMRT